MGLFLGRRRPRKGWGGGSGVGSRAAAAVTTSVGDERGLIRSLEREGSECLLSGCTRVVVEANSSHNRRAARLRDVDACQTTLQKHFEASVFGPSLAERRSAVQTAFLHSELPRKLESLTSS